MISEITVMTVAILIKILWTYYRMSCNVTCAVSLLLEVFCFTLSQNSHVVYSLLAILFHGCAHKLNLDILLSLNYCPFIANVSITHDTPSPDRSHKMPENTDRIWKT